MRGHWEYNSTLFGEDRKRRVGEGGELEREGRIKPPALLFPPSGTSRRPESSWWRRRRRRGRSAGWASSAALCEEPGGPTRRSERDEHSGRTAAFCRRR